LLLLRKIPSEVCPIVLEGKNAFQIACVCDSGRNVTAY